MIPWALVDAAPIPGSQGGIRLMRRGDEFSIRLDGVELMNSRLGGSEEALATLTCERLDGRPSPRILIGGLGMGFTLRAALPALGPAAEVVVAELVPAVVAWARGPLADLFAGCLDDRRVGVLETDVGTLIRSQAGAYDAILLDVDNGPAGQTREGNDGLYGRRGLADAHRALRPGGVLSIWSAHPDAAFPDRMRRAGFLVEEVRVRAHAAKRGARHTIWLGTRR